MNIREIARGIHSQVPIRLFDSGTWHDKLLSGQRIPDRTTFFLPSTSPIRHDSLLRAINNLGLSATLKRIRGPEIEEGTSPADRGLNKVLYAVSEFMQQGYWEDRHPAELTIIGVAVDSRDVCAGEYRDKAETPEIWLGQYREEWERIALGESRNIDKSGYALGTVLGNKLRLFSLTDSVQARPISRSVVLREFATINHWELVNGNAHGLRSEALIRAGELRVQRENGQVLLGRAARDGVYGASIPHMEALLLYGLKQTLAP